MDVPSRLGNLVQDVREGAYASVSCLRSNAKAKFIDIVSAGLKVCVYNKPFLGFTFLSSLLWLQSPSSGSKIVELEAIEED